MKKTAYRFLFLFLVGIVISCNSDDDSNESDSFESDLNEIEGVPTEYEGWTLEWNEEFNDEQINTNNWN